MLRRILLFAAFLSVAITVFVQSQELLLTYFVLFSGLLLPLLFFMEEAYQSIFVPAFIIIACFYSAYLIRYPSLEMILFGAGQIVFFLIFVFYRSQWKDLLLIQTEDCEASLRDLEALKQKHNSRLESLHHLEKQVAGLLDLFEIARDFNDYLDFEGMARLVRERVLPELPFRRLRLIVPDASSVRKVFSITADEIQEGGEQESLTAKEQKLVEESRISKKMRQEDRDLIFPLISDNEMAASLIIEETQPDDLAKFEVLAAYMTLQVRKVRLYQTVRELSIRDGLTGLFVRRHFMERFDEELKRSIKYNLRLAVLMLDIDHFKRYNDDYGHLAGDATLKQVAVLLRESLRKVDIVARFGGEEFVIILPETRRPAALEVAERIRSSIARHNFKVYNDHTRVTVSIGIALFPEETSVPSAEQERQALALELIQHADKALYRAKEEGRNRVVLYQDL